MKKYYFSQYFLSMACTFLLLAGCERSPVVRAYTEITLAPESSPKKPSGPNAFPKGMMPEDDIHKDLMPQDDIHKGLMPQDDIHTGLMPQDDIRTGLMPDDDIHRGITAQGQAPAGMDMKNMALDPRLNDSVDRTPLKWTTPEGWLESKGSGMRLATFVHTDKNNPIEVSIISLGGSAGGLSGNIVRWMQQINVPVPAGAEWERFMGRQENFKTVSGLPVVLIDFTELQKEQKGDAPSMMAAVIDRQDAQIFIKMTGSKQAVIASRAAFRSLAESIEVRE